MQIATLLRRAREARTRYLRKATYLTSDLSSNGGLLVADQFDQFLEIVTDSQVLLPLMDKRTPKGPLLEIDTITLNGVRVLKAGATNAPEGDRVPSGARTKPVTGKIQLTSQLFKGEVPITEEVLEDNIEKYGHLDHVMRMVGEAVGRDFEEVALKSKSTATAHTDTLFATQDGLLQQMDASVAAGQKYTATNDTDPEPIFDGLIDKMPTRFKQNMKPMIFCSTKVVNSYTKNLSTRGTTLGDDVLVNGIVRPEYRGYPIIELPLLGTAAEAGIGNIDYSAYAFFTDPKNLIAMWQRAMRVKKWTDEREGLNSILVSGRFAVKVALFEAVTFTKTITNAAIV